MRLLITNYLQQKEEAPSKVVSERYFIKKLKRKT